MNIKKAKIKSMKCINDDLRACDHMYIGSVFGDRFVPYYCGVEEKEIIDPKGQKECGDFLCHIADPFKRRKEG